MKKKYILISTLTLALTVVGCSSSNSSEKEEFSDSVIATNVESALNGFTLNGTILQTRYAATDTGETDDWGDTIYEIEYDDIQDTNTYYTNIMFDNKDQNKFYKYSYRSVSGVEIAAEGPYTYYEDDEGYAYTVEIDYTNSVTQSYALSNYRLLNFAANGFYNFFTILNDNDFTLDEERSTTVMKYYDLNTYKANIIANNLLYSLNSGVYSTIEEAYILVRNNVFTQLVINFTPIQSVDDDTSEVTYIGNEVTFEFVDIGETTIADVTAYSETTASRQLDAVLDQFDDNFTIEVTNSYTKTDSYSSSSSVTEYRDFYLTGDKIYVHNGTTGGVDTDNDYYLAPLEGSSSNALYPYVYNSDTNSWEAEESDSIYNSDNTSTIFASSYIGFYTYEDLLPKIAEVSGAVFEYNSNTGRYSAQYDVISGMLSDNCFVINKAPLRFNQYPNTNSINLYLTDDGYFYLTASYYYTDYNADTYMGTLTATFKDVGTTTLPV